MAHRKSLEALHRTLQDLGNNKYLMGGVPILLCGDFRQTLPIIPRGTPADGIFACLKSSTLWNNVSTIHLRQNMRVTISGAAGEKFAKNLLAIGEGKFPVVNDGISLTPDLCILVESLSDLVAKVYPNIGRNYLNQDWLRERAILAARNEDVDNINNLLLDTIPGTFVEYRSIDSTVEVDDAVNIPVEFLNSQNPAGLPPHLLRLKIGCPIMLLRNLRPPKLCKVILTGVGRGEVVFIPRIPLISSDLPFSFKRLQLPVRPAYTMTINKSQGQSIPYCGVNLASQCFSHGQLYVAFSRAGSPSDLFVYAPEGKTRNIVYREVL